MVQYLRVAALVFGLGNGLVLTSIHSANGQTVHTLTVSRHSSISMTDAQADANLAEASRVLQEDADFSVGTDDVQCPVTLRRSGSISTFVTSAPAIINTQADADAVDAEPAFIKVVTAINFCGTVGSFAGCATTPGRTIAVVRSGGFQGPVWAHEFGHSTGLPHRTVLRALMTEAALGADNTRVLQAECDSFINGPPAIRGAPGISMASQSAPSHSDRAQQSLSELVRRAFVDAMPYEEILTAGKEELSAIAPLLFEFGEQDNWSNIAVALGILGDANDAELLFTFIRSDLVGARQDAILRGKTGALIGLGYYLNRTGDLATISFLLSAARSDFWESSLIRSGTSSSHTDSLRKTALLALALSGRTEVSALVQSSTKVFADDSFAQQMAKVHAQVVQLGLSGYYSHR